MGIVAVIFGFLLCLAGPIAVFIWVRRRSRKEKALAAKVGDYDVLPFSSTVQGALTVTWDNRWEYLKLSWYWQLLLLPLAFIMGWYSLAYSGTPYCPGTAHLKQYASDFWLTNVIFYAVNLLATASIAVAWHRFILADEPVSLNQARLDKVVWRYAAFSLVLLVVLAIALFLPLFAAGLLLVAMKKLTIAVLILPSALVVTIALVAHLYSCLTRVAVALPGIALQMPWGFEREVLRKTRWSFWPFVFGEVVCSALPTAMILVLQEEFTKAACGNHLALALLGAFFQILIGFVTVPIILSYLSLSYRHFFGKHLATSR